MRVKNNPGLLLIYSQDTIPNYFKSEGILNIFSKQNLWIPRPRGSNIPLFSKDIQQVREGEERTKLYILPFVLLLYVHF